jgi:long-chain fatty acid transport protein
MNRFALRRLISVLCTSGMLATSTQVFASAYQLWEQDGASVGNYHAGYAAAATDASISFYNPAGITRFKNQQLVLSADSIMTSFKYQGTVGVNTILAGQPRTASGQGGNYSLVPSLHYVAPLSEILGFGFSVDVPFGLKTTYGRQTIIRYVTTTAALTVVDISPALAIQLNPKASFGAGLDIQRMYAEIDKVGGLGFPTFEAQSYNKANDTGYGYHLGGLYQFSPQSRLGLSYHSQVVHHLTGSSAFVGPLAIAFADHSFSSQAYANITLPPYTALSIYHKFFPALAIMGSAIYTQWNVQTSLAMHNLSGIEHLQPSKSINVSIPEFSRNTWNFSVGADYNATDAIILRGALGYDQTPILTKYRNLLVPDNDRFVMAMGAHYQASKAIGLDAGWSHFFIQQATINPPPQASGDQVVITNGSSNGGADVLAAQITWDIA